MLRQTKVHIEGPGAWIGAELQDDPVWIYRLDQVAVDEIDAALENLKRRGVRIPFGVSDFPLPTFAGELDRILEELE